MDKFGVPKKINRHVLKALYYLSDSGLVTPELSAICERVEITMKHTLPVRDLPGMVEKSLQNMAQLGVIKVDGSNYFIRKIESVPPPAPERQGPNIFRLNLDCQDNDRKLKRRRKASPEKSKRRAKISKPLTQKGPQVLLRRAEISKGLNFCADANQEDVGPLDNGSQLPQVGEYGLTEAKVQEETLIEPSEELQPCNLNVNTDPLLELGKKPDDGVVIAELTVKEEPKEQANRDDEFPTSTTI